MEETLPFEVLTEIFLHLSAQERLTLSEVCKRFYSVLNSYVFLNKISANLTDYKSFETSTRKYVNVKFAGTKINELDEFSRQSEHSSSVKRCKFENVEVSGIKTWIGIIKSFHNLIDLHLEGISSSSCFAFKSFEMPHLKTFKFFYCTNELLKHFTEAFGTMKIFKISLLPHKDKESRNQSFDFVFKILNNNKLSVEKINLYDTNFDDDFLELISKLKFCRLLTFSMSFSSSLSHESLGFVNFIKQVAESLQKFKVRLFDSISQHNLRIIENAINLKSLNLIICCSSNYESFSNFRNHKKLEKLTIRPENFQGNSSYKSFIENKILSHKNENMKFLSIECARLSNEFIGKIITAFPNLEYLYFPSALDSELCQVNLLNEKLKKLRNIVVC